MLGGARAEEAAGPQGGAAVWGGELPAGRGRAAPAVPALALCGRCIAQPRGPAIRCPPPPRPHHLSSVGFRAGRACVVATWARPAAASSAAASRGPSRAESLSLARSLARFLSLSLSLSLALSLSPSLPLSLSLSGSCTAAQ